MWNRIKAALMRIYYRWENRRVWAGSYDDKPVSNLQIPGAAGPVPIRIYASSATGELPVILYFHGGGWVIGDLESHHPFCQVLAQSSGATVVAVDYRLAPQYPYPASNEDCLAAAQWTASNLAATGPNNGRLVIAGDSAGGNLTAATCLALGEEARSKLAGAVTLYPAVDHYSNSRPSHTERGKAQPLTMNIMTWFWDTWLEDTQAGDAKLARPLLWGELSRMPPLFNVTAEFDVLRDEGRAFAAAVQQAGVAVEQHHYSKAAHGFACSTGPSGDFTRNMERLVSWLRALS
jgi:acetyl esterase/lipase